MLDDSIDAVVAVRGGYGAMRLLAALDTRVSTAGSRPRRVTGFSDVTAIHAWVHQTLGWASIHSAMPFNFGSSNDPETVQSATWLIERLTEPEPSPSASGQLIPVRPGHTTGVLRGGNLSLVEAMYRSPWLPTLEGAILFVEDVGEARYRLDRLVTSLALRGAAAEVAGVVVGGFTGCGSTPDVDARFVADEFATWGVPVAMGLDAGHRQPNRPLWLGLEHSLDADNGVLTCVVGGTS